MARRLITRVVRRAAARAAAPTGLRFTERQLHHEICRMLLPIHRLPRWIPFTAPLPLPGTLLRTMVRCSGDVDGLLDPPTPITAEPGAHTVEDDLFDYALPRLLICQSTAVAAMLRANGLPMESACPVLAVDELPLSSGLIRMLEASALSGPGARIYVLHDDSPSGLDLPGSLGRFTRLPESATVVPIGLRRSQTAPLHLFRTGLLPSSPVEVESVPPAMLLRSVHRLVRDVHRERARLVRLRAAQSTGFLSWPRGSVPAPSNETT